MSPFNIIGKLRTLSLVPKIALSVSTIGVAATSLVVVGGHATFTDSKTQAQSIGTRPLALVIGTAGTANNRLSIAAANILPGDTVQRAIDITNSGALAYSTLSLTTTATTSTLLDTDATNGLQMVLDECSVAWTEAGTPPAYTYTCSGTTTPHVTTRAVVGSGLAVNGAALTAGATGHYRVTLTLPSGAGNTFAGLTSVISYAFTAA